MTGVKPASNSQKPKLSNLADMPEPKKPYSWQRRGGYEVSSKGDTRFSALFARMPDGRTIEQWYQCDVKGHDPLGTNWKEGKGKPPLHTFADGELYRLYKALWQMWALQNIQLITELSQLALEKGGVLSDCFANTECNQARALSEILNEWCAD